METISSFITDPGQIVQFPIILMEQTMTFVTLIMNESFKFASAIAKLMV